MRKMKRRQIYLTDEEVRIAQAIGGGNMSKGIREALKVMGSLADAAVSGVNPTQPHVVLSQRGA